MSRIGTPTDGQTIQRAGDELPARTRFWDCAENGLSTHLATPGYSATMASEPMSKPERHAVLGRAFGETPSLLMMAGTLAYDRLCNDYGYDRSYKSYIKDLREWRDLFIGTMREDAAVALKMEMGRTLADANRPIEKISDLAKAVHSLEAGYSSASKVTEASNAKAINAYDVEKARWQEGRDDGQTQDN